MRLAIIGSRSITDDAFILKTVDKHVKELNPSCILIGDAKGIDPAVAHYAQSHEIDIIRFLPYHLLDPTSNFDSKYFFVRTKQMIDNADKVLAIWDTRSKGTEYGIKYSQKRSLPVMVVSCITL